MTQRSSRLQGGPNPKKIIGLIIAALLIAAAAVMAVRVANLVSLTQVEASLTPTPVPAYGNVMVVTLDPNAPTPAPVIRHGAQGEQVKTLQSRLQALGYYEGAIDGQFGNGTRNAVILFQQQHGLQPDGIVGEDTSSVLYSAQAQRIIITPTPSPKITPTPAPNEPGLDALKEVYEELGLPLNGDSSAIFGSSDAGNVSFVCPTFHPCLQVAEKGVAIHTREFAKAMKSQRAYKALDAGAKIIAYQICKIFSDEEKIAALQAAIQ